MKEIWKDIPDYEGYYQVSNLGRVKSLRTNIILKAHPDRYGYNHVVFSVNQIRKGFTVHRLVAKAFIPNPHNYETVNHKDFNRVNNNVLNLEWSTIGDNVRYTIEHRGRGNPVRAICPHTLKVYGFRNAKIGADFVEGNNSCIIACCKGKKHTYKGYVWRYINEGATTIETTT